MFSYTRNGSLELNSEFYYGAYIATHKHGTEEYFSQSFVTCSFQFFSLLFTLFHSGAITATPEQASDANICPRGKFCVEGTDEPEPCPAGTFSNVLGKLHQLYQCAFSL